MSDWIQTSLQALGLIIAILVAMYTIKKQFEENRRQEKQVEKERMITFLNAIHQELKLADELLNTFLIIEEGYYCPKQDYLEIYNSNLNLIGYIVNKNLVYKIIATYKKLKILLDTLCLQYEHDLTVKEVYSMAPDYYRHFATKQLVANQQINLENQATMYICNAIIDDYCKNYNRYINGQKNFENIIKQYHQESCNLIKETLFMINCELKTLEINAG